jgi:hypothetical protein
MVNNPKLGNNAPVQEYSWFSMEFSEQGRIFAENSIVHIDQKDDSTWTADLELYATDCRNGHCIDTLPKLKIIDDGAFYYTEGYGETLNLGNTVEVIGEEAFAYAKLKGTVELPASLKRVGARAFYYNNDVSRVNFNNLKPWDLTWEGSGDKSENFASTTVVGCSQGIIDQCEEGTRQDQFMAYYPNQLISIGSYLVVDLNGDGKTTEDDRYFTHHPAPDWIFGLTTRLTWKKWSLSTSLRANVGNYVYNYIAMNTGAYETAFYISGQMNMLNASYLSTDFQRRQMLSDHYLENASFLKMDNLQLGYNFGKISKYVAVNISFMVQNVFTVTKYTGIDPEVNGGFDNTLYPRPRTYSFTIGVEF